MENKIQKWKTRGTRRERKTQSILGFVDNLIYRKQENNVNDVYCFNHLLKEI